MSIEMDNPTTVLEKVDAASNLLAQMYLAHMLGDEGQFGEAYARALKLLSDAVADLGEADDA